MKKAPAKTNREWHEQHRMPRNATFTQRVSWHIAHAANCNCRKMPDNIEQAIKERATARQQDEKA